MYNQNQFGQNMGMGIPNLPSPKELWKDEKTKYRPWIMLLVVGLTIIIALLVAGIIVNALNIESIQNQIINHPDNELTVTAVEELVRENYIILPAISIALITLGTIFYIKSLIISYKKQSFAYLSTWGTFIVGFGALLAAYELLQLIWNPSSERFTTTAGILGFAINIVYIATYIVISRKVTMIRKSFILSERVAMLKNSPLFNQNIQQPQGFKNAYGPTAAHSTPGSTTPSGGLKPASGTTQATVQAPINPELAKLQKMSVADLIKVASKLSISGASEMEKPELIDAIMKVTSGK